METFAKGLVAAFILSSPLALSAAEASTETCPFHPLLRGLMLAAVFSVMGVAILILCFKAFDKVITKIDFEEEIKKGNVSAGIVGAAVIIGIAIIIAASIAG